MSVTDILNAFEKYKEASLHGRYLTQKQIQPLLDKYADHFKITLEGYSENRQPIHLIKLGTGAKKLLFWSQMHGNESTTTKAIFDVLHFLSAEGNDSMKFILEACTLYIIPMLNPDGAEKYTRVNYNKVDLNRDAQNCSQAESTLFRKIVDRVKPQVAFNLHGQRTIFSVGTTNKSATVSFLSPASDAERTITESRKRGMRIIAEMNKALQHYIPNGVGRYDDSFNINCTGDTMEASGYTTILFEAGHHPNDYFREITRKWMFLSLVTAIDFISTQNQIPTVGYEAYFNIPENGKCFNDFIVRNLMVKNDKKDVAIQFEEQLINRKIEFIPKIAEIATNIKNFGHLELDAAKQNIQFSNVLDELKKGDKLKYLSINNEKFSVFPIKI